MPESVQSCFELSIHLSVSEPAVNCSKNSSREKNTGKCMESSKHDWTLSGTERHQQRVGSDKIHLSVFWET